MPQVSVAELLDYGSEIVSGLEQEPGARSDRIKVRPLRSVLFIPGHRRDWIRKAKRFGADGIVLDLEDSVQPADRNEARQVIGEEIGELSRQVSSVWVRVNSQPEELALDLAAVVRPGLAVIMLPKAFGPDTTQALDRMLGYHEGRAGLGFCSLAICPILETAGGVRTCFDIAMCSARVEYMGGVVAPQGDTAQALRMDVMSDPIGTESLYLRSKIIVDVRSAGLRYPIGGTVTDLNPDHRVLRPFAEMNKKIGHSGMMVIHPSHVAPVNEIFSPSQAEIAHSLTVLAAIRNSPHGAVRTPDGKMIDFAHARFAAQLLAEAHALGIELPASVSLP